MRPPTKTEGGRVIAGQQTTGRAREINFSFEQALSVVRDKLSEVGLNPAIETVPLDRAQGRILAENVKADRDYPPFHRAARDGYALRSSDVGVLPANLKILGEVRAGDHFSGHIGPGECVEIMTGAPVPEGANAIVMLEQTRLQGERVQVLQAVKPGENFVARASEARAGLVVLRRGCRLRAAEMALLASVGCGRVQVFARPIVAILTTGDEVVPVEQSPQWFQIRNSNAVAVGAQVAAAGGVPWQLGIARDEKPTLRTFIEEGLTADLLLLSGGVSAGKHDLVEEVLGELGAEFYFRSVLIRPGKPLVFGRVGSKFFFGLPGNPVSTLVTFHLFVRPAIRMTGGAEFECPGLLRARLAKPFAQKLGLTVFVPARVEVLAREPRVSPVNWQGSGDLVGLAAADYLMVVHPEQNELAPGDWVDVLQLGD